MSVFFLCAHRNQRSLSLNLKHPEGQAVAKRLIAEADVLVQNFRPGVMDRFGLSYAELRPLNPRLIYVSASGYGENSLYKDRPGQDLLLQAISGFAAASGRGDGPPTPAGFPAVDQHGAALLAMGVLGALFQRTRTGLGLKVEVSMLRAALDLQMEAVTYHLNGAKLRRSPTCLGSTFHPGPYGIYATKGGGYIALSMSPLQLLAQALGLGALLALAKEPHNFAAREQIARIIEPIMSTRTTAEWLEFLVPKGVWAAPVLDYEGTFRDPAVQEADTVLEVDHPVAGKIRLLRFPLEFSTGRAAVRRVHPMPGEHTIEILKELGYNQEEACRLRDLAVILIVA
jgi:crotonobetainyl-CoA:carnitine CoA-transferase CaiB-like acyl-CoA transferase